MKRSHDQGHSSLADIAMLLLIFFLVTTQFPKQEGIKTTLPPMLPVINSEKNLKEVEIWLNAQDQVMIDNTLQPMNDIASVLSNHLLESNNTIQVTLKSHKNASYPAYVGVYDQIKSAYKRVYNYEALKQYGKEFEQLPQGKQAEITSRLPIKIFEGDLIQ